MPSFWRRARRLAEGRRRALYHGRPRRGRRRRWRGGGRTPRRLGGQEAARAAVCGARVDGRARKLRLVYTGVWRIREDHVVLLHVHRPNCVQTPMCNE